ncbi:Retrotransposon gag protein [Cynara cardunculus var. scolymus]|uniref:Retrotransposon gag protein n=1 Tax=Cynara cardunculus var. scolymus TaxID=59895 RepID=A0A103YLB6_CYNCS|nr:Retrotransposon gag protein [Cynara cardunculus var. scolymus]
MAPTTRRSSGESSQDPNLRRVLMFEVGEALQTMIPELFEQMKAELKIELGQMMDERITTLGANHNKGLGRANVLRDFMACNPPNFKGQKDPLESAFRTSFCPAANQVLYATTLLQGTAKIWLNLTCKTIPEEELNAMTWNDFKTRFSKQFVPQIEVEQVTKEFLDMKQTTESVNEITDKFMEKALFCPQYIADETMKLFRYTEMLKPEIRSFVALARCKTLAEAIEIARAQELDLDIKRKTAPSHEAMHLTRNSNPLNQRTKTNHLNQGTKEVYHCVRSATNTTMGTALTWHVTNVEVLVSDVDYCFLTEFGFQLVQTLTQVLVSDVVANITLTQLDYCFVVQETGRYSLFTFSVLVLLEPDFEHYRNQLLFYIRCSFYIVAVLQVGHEFDAAIKDTDPRLNKTVLCEGNAHRYEQLQDASDFIKPSSRIQENSEHKNPNQSFAPLYSRREGDNAYLSMERREATVGRRRLELAVEMRWSPSIGTRRRATVLDNKSKGFDDINIDEIDNIGVCYNIGVDDIDVSER